MTTETFATEIEKCAGEPIEAIVISGDRSGWGSRDKWPEWAGKILTWELARPALNYTYDAGYGGQDCHSIYAWTEHWVLLVAEYDGSTHVARIPRNPTEGIPKSI